MKFGGKRCKNGVSMAGDDAIALKNKGEGG